MFIQDRTDCKKLPVCVLRWGRIIIGLNAFLAAFGDER